MKDNKSSRWSVGCKIVQWRVNTQIHRGIGNKIPYSLAFGHRPRAGISSLPLEATLLETIATETALNHVLAQENNCKRKNSDASDKDEDALSQQRKKIKPSNVDADNIVSEDDSPTSKVLESESERESETEREPETQRKKHLQLNGLGKFESTSCDFCDRGMPSENRCRMAIPNGKFTFSRNNESSTVLICGKTFCAMCMFED